MLFGLLAVGIAGYGTYKGARGMWADSKRWAEHAHWAWAFLPLVLVLAWFGVNTWLWY